MRIISIRTIIASIALGAMVTLAGCNKDPGDNAMPTKAFVGPGITLKLDPPDAPDCKRETVYKATLSWSVDGKDAPKTEVRIGKPDGAIFARSNDKTARAETDNWVKPGTWFLLFDRKGGDLLGAVQAGPQPCP